MRSPARGFDAPNNGRMRPVAVVTGPTAGIGRGFAEYLAREGHDLVLVARDRARLDALAADLVSRFGIEAEVLVADLAQRADIDRVADVVATRADVLVNNAGFGLKRSFVSTSVDDEQALLDVLVTAVMRLTHAALPRMVTQGRGTIINVSSIASWITSGTYASAKAWVTVFTESLHEQYLPKGVEIIAVCPGYVHTEFHERAGIKAGQGIMWLNVDQVVHSAMRDARRGKAISVAGWQYKPLAAFLRIAPRWLVRRMTADRRREVRSPQQ